MTEEDNNITSELKEGNLSLHPLQKVAVIGMMCLMLLTFALANFQSIVWLNSDWLVSTILPAIVTDATNSARSGEGLTLLQRNEALDLVAELKAQDMAEKEYFSHWSPEGVSPWHWFNVVGYEYLHAGENLAVHFTDSESVVDAWLDSPTHRANILNNSYQEIGVGTAKGKYEGYDTVFVVQVFGTPAATIPRNEESTTILGKEVEDSLSEDVVAAGVPTAEEPQIKQTDIEVAITEGDTLMYESFVSDTGEVMGVNEVAGVTSVNEVSFWERMITSPRLVLQLVYSIIGLVVFVVLVAAVVIEWRRHHPIQIAYSALLLTLMVFLFQLHLAISGGAVIA